MSLPQTIEVKGETFTVYPDGSCGSSSGGSGRIYPDGSFSFTTGDGRSVSGKIMPDGSIYWG